MIQILKAFHRGHLNLRRLSIHNNTYTKLHIIKGKTDFLPVLLRTK